MVKDPPQSPKTITARGSCQDQDITIKQQEEEIDARKIRHHPETPGRQPTERPSISRPKQCSDQLDGFVGWWRRVENVGEKEGAAMRMIEEEEDGRKRKSEAKISFLRKFFPEIHSSPGGSDKLQKIQDRTDRLMNGNSDILTKVGNRQKQAHKISSHPLMNITPSKRKTPLGPTLFSSPSKRQKTLTSFSENLNYWIRKDDTSRGDLEGLAGGLTLKPEEQKNWRQDYE